MSIASEITRIKANIANAYTACEGKGATLPQTQNSANLAAAINGISAGIPVETLTYSQMNAHAGAFISGVSYNPSDYTVSHIAEYAVSGYTDANPAGAAVSIPAAGTLTVTDGSRSYSQTVSAGSHTIYNITPGNVGSYILRSTNDETIAAGLLKPTGSLRMLTVRHMFNVRDLGGWACDGGRVRYGMLIRGSDTDTLEADDAAFLHDFLGIRAELSLLWGSEDTRTASPIGSDVAFRHIDGPMYTTGAGNWQEDAFRQILDFVMDSVIAGKPLYFHCYYGADRTATIAFILEALLGVSQSDTDKDYEITSFYTGAESDSAARRRNESEWQNYMAEFSAFPGSTMRDKVVYFVQTQGITIEKINAYRAAMTDGTPGALTSSVGSVSVTNTLSGAATDNNAASVVSYQPYQARITPDGGKVITGVTVTMGGADITEQVFTGTETMFRHAVTYQLTHCRLSENPARKAVVSGECFCCQLQPDAGYTLDGATVLIMMGGTDMSNYYKDGMIQIPKVTGNITVTVTAAESTPPYTNLVDKATWKTNYRLRSNGTLTASSGASASNFIPVKAGDVLRVKGWDFRVGPSDGQGYVYGYSAADESATDAFAAVSMSGTGNDTYAKDAVTELADGTLEYVVAMNNKGNNVMTSACNYIRITAKSPDNLDNVIITVNEEIT